MWVIPSWRVVAQIPKKQDGASALARSDFLSLTVSDSDLEAVLRAVKASGYKKVTFEREHSFNAIQQTTDAELTVRADLSETDPKEPN